MADPLVISALMKKRAGIDGELRRTAKRLADLRAGSPGPAGHPTQPPPRSQRATDGA
jgi:hypothetical protein